MSGRTTTAKEKAKARRKVEYRQKRKARLLRRLTKSGKRGVTRSDA